MKLLLCVLLRLASIVLGLLTAFTTAISFELVREAGVPIILILLVLGALVAGIIGFWHAGGWCLKQ